MTPVIYKKSIPAAPEKFAEIARLLGGKDENELVDILEQLLESLELKTSLGNEGVKMEDVDWMTENAFKVSLASINNHPRVFTKEEVREIYIEAM